MDSCLPHPEEEEKLQELKYYAIGNCIHLYLCLYVCAYMYTCMAYSTLMEVRGHFFEIGSFLLPCGFWGSNLDLKAWHISAFNEKSHWLYCRYLKTHRINIRSFLIFNIIKYHQILQKITV